jgi:hypothetical protein
MENQKEKIVKLEKELRKEREHKKILLLIIFFIVFFVFTSVIQDYQYNNCVKNNNRELEECNKRNSDSYDCSVFENAEDLCKMIY